MPILRPVFHFVSPLLLAAATLAGGCTQPYKSIACGADTDCPSADQIGHVTYDDAGISYIVVNGVPTETGINEPPPAQCCAGACVIQASGCDSGFRYIAKHSGSYDVSVCVDVSLMCMPPAQPASP